MIETIAGIGSLAVMAVCAVRIVLHASDPVRKPNKPRDGYEPAWYETEAGSS